MALQRTSVKRGISEHCVKEIVSASFDELSFQVRKLEAGVTEGICIHTPHWKTHVFNFQTWKQLLLSGGEMKSQASFCKPHAKKKEARRQVTAHELLLNDQPQKQSCWRMQRNSPLHVRTIIYYTGVFWAFTPKWHPSIFGSIGSNYFEKSIYSHARKMTIEIGKNWIQIVKCRGFWTEIFRHFKICGIHIFQELAFRQIFIRIVNTWGTHSCRVRILKSHIFSPATTSIKGCLIE